MAKNSLGFFIGAAAAAVLAIIFLATGLWKYFFLPKTEEISGTVVITLGEGGAVSIAGDSARTLRDESLSVKIPMREGETVIAVFNRESEDGIAEEQFVAYLPPPSNDRRINIAYISYDPAERKYIRQWNEAAAATRPETVSLYNMDLIGDRNNCIIITGMNAQGEHTMTVLRKNPDKPAGLPFDIIAEIRADGSIIIQETARAQAYQQGITTGQSYNIASYGHDSLSNNLLDQIEITYSYNSISGVYEQAQVTRIPGTQIEQQRIRELLSGTPGVFENFLNDLWYYVSSAGTVDSEQYIYFDPSGKEIIFYGDDAQQIFSWQNYSYTWNGMYIRSQNISISTLLRSIYIELESLESIRLRVTEDVQLTIGETRSPWDGSYRRASAANQPKLTSVKQGINAEYDGLWGRIHFTASGHYTITSGNPAAAAAFRKGNYVFFKVDANELLEMRPEEYISGQTERMVFKTENTDSGLILTRVRLGTNGVQDLYEPPIILTQVE